ncbi:acyl-CoA thioesterase [Desulfosediminicola flagellatus]|uniref:acyl-CoA thioesterase n=1 Tax=Desulfosediminicola flagellatus TaxID=2569541 RepID=UPI00142F20B8|nr:thioesterase family protein [Desulfosediminicola flagellatus]
MAPFIRHRKVRFEDCDPAGIVFYPNYILMLHRHFEDWFADGLGASLGTMNLNRKIGFPIKHLTVDFQRPSRLEDELEWSLTVIATRASSITLAITAQCNKETRIKAELIVVAVNLSRQPLSPCITPEDISIQLQNFADQAT